LTTARWVVGALSFFVGGFAGLVAAVVAVGGAATMMPVEPDMAGGTAQTVAVTPPAPVPSTAPAPSTAPTPAPAGSVAEPAPQPASSAAPSPRAAAPEPEAEAEAELEPEPEEEDAEVASGVVLSGDEPSQVWLEMGGQKFEPGPVGPGTYAIIGSLGTGPVQFLGEVTVVAGQQAVVKCSESWGKCRQ